MQNWLWNICLDFTAKELWPINSSKLNPQEYYILGHVRGLSHAPSKIKHIAKFKEILQLNSWYNKKICKRILYCTHRHLKQPSQKQNITIQWSIYTVFDDNNIFLCTTVFRNIKYIVSNTSTMLLLKLLSRLQNSNTSLLF